MKTIVHVNQFVIKSNLKNKKTDPVLTVKNYKENRYAQEVVIKDKSGNIVGKIIYSPEKPLSCGARVWIEFYSDHIDLELINDISCKACNFKKRKKNDSNGVKVHDK